MNYYYLASLQGEIYVTECLGYEHYVDSSFYILFKGFKEQCEEFEKEFNKELEIGLGIDLNEPLFQFIKEDLFTEETFDNFKKNKNIEHFLNCLGKFQPSYEKFKNLIGDNECYLYSPKTYKCKV